MNIIVREAVYLIDIWFPACHKCKEELKPYILDEEEQILLGRELLQRMRQIHYTAEKLSDGRLIILLCDRCLKIDRRKVT